MAELLTERLAVIARDHARREALVDGNERVSYAQLWAAANAFAGFLANLGLTRGARVAVILPNGSAAIAAVYGTWLAGGVVVPLNAQARARDFLPWLLHCEPEVLVYDATSAEARRARDQLPQLRAVLAVGGTDLPPLELSWPQAIGSAPASPSGLVLVPADPAMILYTSGTTGQPKGVTLSHGNLAANVASIIQYLGLTAQDSVVSVLPFYYSYGASVLHTHLMVGARIILEHNLVFPHVVVDTMVREAATGFSGVPSTFALLLSRVDLGRYPLRSLRYLTQAGGAMPNAVTLKLLAALPQARLFVMYGQTEATARLTFLQPERLPEKLGSVGMPIPGIELQVRDQQGNVLGAGATGEIWVRGANVMLGYWRDPEATAQVLHEGWLRTGDMGYRDADGFLFLSGRRSDMIKTGAHRVHPKDVEEAIAELDGVQEVAAIGIDDEVLGQAIKVFVVATPGGSVDPMTIKAHCRERLAAYKIPKQVEFVASLPKTASGKVRRFELALPAKVHTEEHRD